MGFSTSKAWWYSVLLIIITFIKDKFGDVELKSWVMFSKTQK